MIMLALHLGVDDRFGEEVQIPQVSGENLSGCFDLIARVLDKRPLGLVLEFPSEPSRGRVYATAFGENYQPIGFAKIASSAGEPERLYAESRTLKEVAALPGRTYSVPTFIELAEVGSLCILVSESLPRRSRSGVWRERDCNGFQVSSARRHVEPDALESLSWWLPLQKRLTDDHASFARALEQYRTYGLSVGRSHGDFGPANIVISAGRSWIFDWEHSEADAPDSTDVIGWFLGCRHRRVMSAPASVLQELRRRFYDGKSDREKADVLFSLAYRLACNVGNASHLLRHWRS